MMPRRPQDGSLGPRQSRVVDMHTPLHLHRDPFALRLMAALKSHWLLVVVSFLLKTRGAGQGRNIILGGVRIQAPSLV